MRVAAFLLRHKYTSLTQLFGLPKIGEVSFGLQGVSLRSREHSYSGMETLVRIEVGCVAWQVENLDAIGSLGKPGFDWF